MKKLYTAIFVSLLAAPVYAAPSNPAMGTPPQQMTAQSQQMMSHEVMRNMMNHMQVMTQDMTQMMQQTRTMDQDRLRDMSKVMDQLSQHMHTMSVHMNEGKMDPKVVKEMEQNMEKIQNMIKTMQQQKP